MSATYKDGQITFCAEAIFDGLRGADRDHFIDRMACTEAVIKCVSDQILEGWTQLGSHGLEYGPGAEPRSALECAVREVAARSSEVAKREIERLQAELKASKIARQRADEIKWSMYRQMCGIVGDEGAERVLKVATAKAEGRQP